MRTGVRGTRPGRAARGRRWPAAAAALTTAALPAVMFSAGLPASAAASLPAALAGPAGPGHALAGHALAGHGPARQYGASTQVGTCSRGPSGRPVDCPAALPPAALPAGARNAAQLPSLVTRPATVVDTRTWTSAGGNTFPGADVPFGMMQWSPDTLPHRNDGGGYNYGDTQLTGYSLTHLSGPGCSGAGDVPILPMTGTLPGGDPSNVVTPFSNQGEIATAGYYSAQSNQPATITSEFTETPHSGLGRFTFPATSSADLLVKLNDSQNGDRFSTAQVIGRNEISGSDTSGNFCGEHKYYTVYFDLLFSQPFRSAKVITMPGQSHPDAVFLTFDTTASQVIDAKAGISYVSTAGARGNRQAEDRGWDFGALRAAAQRSWNHLLSRIAVAGGSAAQTQEFYSLLYKDFLEPSITSDVSGEYRGTDGKVDGLAPRQHDQYGMFSGWDIYHSLCQLQAMLDPGAASDMAQSLVNYYTHNGILQQWGYLNQDVYVMTGDPADAIIADYHAFGARGFDTRRALRDMLRQATTVNPVRPGERLEQRYGYLPENGHYGCCNAHGFTSSLLEYDTADFALSRFAAALGRHGWAARLAARANNWANVFDRRTGLLTPRLTSGRFLPGIGPDTHAHYVEGSAQQYLWDVPNNYAGLFSLLGGRRRAAQELRQYLSRPAAGNSYAQPLNEFDLGEQNAPLYAGDPAAAQRAAAAIRTRTYLPGPSGLANNDDLGAISSQYIWEMLGLYPENPGADTLVFTSPGFPLIIINPGHGRTITIRAPGASARRFYVRSLRINGRAHRRLYVSYARLARGARLRWSLSSRPARWGTGRRAAPPSYGRAPAPPR
jgi:predicted alpha-1,2-mannosidase